MTDKHDWAALLPDGLETLLAPVKEWVGADPDELIPSYQLGTDGPTLKSVFCLFDDVLCETRVTSSPAHFFDFVRIDSFFNLRVKRDEVQLGEGEDVVTYQSVVVGIVHVMGFESELTYLGDDPEHWLAHVRGLFPVGRLAP